MTSSGSSRNGSGSSGVRRRSRPVRVGGTVIGGSAPVSVQGMAKVPAGDVPALLRQAARMASAGAELIRVAVPTVADAAALAALKRRVWVPIVADVHYDHRIALAAIAAGADKIRINPGNMDRRGLREVAAAARERGVAVRIGVNSGSVRMRGSLADSMVVAALDSARFFEDAGVPALVLSLKTPSVAETLTCCRAVAAACDYPLHMGITEAGRGMLAEAKSVLGIGALLLEGIGDTIRVSLTGAPEREIRLGRAVLQAAGLRRFEPEIVSCPTCGRTAVDLSSVLAEVERSVGVLARRRPSAAGLTIAVMGCSVNGPGEARQADAGIAGGKGRFAVFRRGTVIRSVPEGRAVKALMDEITALTGGKDTQ